MGFIKSGLLVVVSVIFFIFLFIMNSLYIVSSSLDYGNIQEKLIPVIKDVLEENINLTSLIENEKFLDMQKFCGNFSEQESDYVFKESNYTFTIPCSVIINGTDSIISYAVDSVAYEYYYKEYDCGFWDCFDKESQPFFIVSEHSKNYWQGKFYMSILILFALLVLMFFLAENKVNLFFIVGPLMIFSALPFSKLNLFFSSIPGEFLKFLAIIFDQSYKIFLIMLIAGLVILAVGVLAKFFIIGFKINEFFSRIYSRKKERIKTEVDDKNKG